MLKFFRSFKHAIAGLLHVTVAEANMRWHLLATVSVVCLGFAFHISLLEWALVLLCVGGVVGLECMNTALERLADRITAEQDPLIRQAKDAAAGGVLAMSMAAAVVGVMVFAPHIVSWLSG